MHSISGIKLNGKTFPSSSSAFQGISPRQKPQPRYHTPPDQTQNKPSSILDLAQTPKQKDSNSFLDLAEYSSNLSAANNNNNNKKGGSSVSDIDDDNIILNPKPCSQNGSVTPAMPPPKPPPLKSISPSPSPPPSLLNPHNSSKLEGYNLQQRNINFPSRLNSSNSSISSADVVSTSRDNSFITKPSHPKAMDMNGLSYHGIRKLAPMPKVTPKCIPIPLESQSQSGSNSNSPMTQSKFGFGISSGSPPLSPNHLLEADDNSSGYSPLLKKSVYGGSSIGIGGVFCEKKNMKLTKKDKKKKQPENSIIGVLAAQTLKIASINGLGELDKLENDLEEEISFENRANAKTVIGRLRREGHHHLHNKTVLFIVVLLNIIDCLLVMGELVLDFHHVSHLLQNKKEMIDSFAEELEDKYDPYLGNLVDEKRHVLLQTILDSSIIWPQHVIKSAVDNVTLAAAQCHNYITSAANFQGQSHNDFVASLPLSNWTTSQPMSTCFQPLISIFKSGAANIGLTTSPMSSSAESGDSMESGESSEDDVEYYKLTHWDERNENLIVVAHKLHYISVAILSVLVILLILKIICAGKRFFHSRMGVFDGIVVVISFILDVVFIKGIHIFNTNDFVIILTFLLPWRIIRVLNSLIAAVLDKQRLNLKIIYTQKKKISRNLTEVNNKVDVMSRQIQILQGLCSSRGISDGDVRKILGTEKPDKHEKGESKKHHSGHGLASMMALGKLAFQAADALAPMPDASGRSTPTSPISAPIFNSNNKLSTSNTTLNNSSPTTRSISSPATTALSPPSSSSTTNSNGVAHAPKANGSVPTGNNINNNINNGNPPQTKNDVIDEKVPNNHNGNPWSFPETQNSPNNVEDSISENLDVPEVSQSPSSLDIESAATISMDLKDDDDDDDDVTTASADDVNVEFRMENESKSLPNTATIDNKVNDSDAVSKL